MDSSETDALFPLGATARRPRIEGEVELHSLPLPIQLIAQPLDLGIDVSNKDTDAPAGRLTASPSAETDRRVLLPGRLHRAAYPAPLLFVGRRRILPAHWNFRVLPYRRLEPHQLIGAWRP